MLGLSLPEPCIWEVSSVCVWIQCYYNSPNLSTKNCLRHFFWGNSYEYQVGFLCNLEVLQNLSAILPFSCPNSNRVRFRVRVRIGVGVKVKVRVRVRVRGTEGVGIGKREPYFWLQNLQTTETVTMPRLKRIPIQLSVKLHVPSDKTTMATDGTCGYRTVRVVTQSGFHLQTCKLLNEYLTWQKIYLDTQHYIHPLLFIW